MTRRSIESSSPPRARLPRLRRIAWLIASLGFFGSAAQAHAVGSLERAALEARVLAVRSALSQSSAEDGDEAPSQALAQWNNWKNWANWNNWKNWSNWLNR